MKLASKFGVSLWLITVSLTLFAADTQKDVERDLRQAYVGHILSLKVPSNSDRLHFGSDGQLIAKLNPAPWTTFGLFRVMQLSVKKERVELQGERVIIAWQVEKIPALMPVEIGRTIRITLESATAISSVDQVNEMISRLFDKGSIDKRITDYWKPNPDAIAALDKPASGSVVLGTLEGNRSVFRGGKGHDIAPPRPLYDPDPTYTTTAKKDRVNGTSTCRLIINEAGLPEIIEIKKGLGDGLDLQAVDAISSWRFAPATMNGKPIPVMVTVEFTFRLL